MFFFFFNTHINLKYFKETDLHTTHNFLEVTIANRIVNSLVASIRLGKLAVVQVTFAESKLIVSNFSIA